MKNSNFEFSDPKVIKFEFSFNKDFNFENNVELECHTNFEVNVSRDKNVKKAIVELIVSINSYIESAPFCVQSVICSAFKWDSGTPEEQVEFILEHNAPALLLSYLRPLIANVTNSSPIGAFNLGFVDFTSNESNE